MLSLATSKGEHPHKICTKTVQFRFLVICRSVGNGGDLQSTHDDGENFLEVLSSKTLAIEMYDPACDYLKKLDSSWEFANSLENQLSGYNGSLIEHGRLTNLSDLVSHWSIAPPNPQAVDHQIAPSPCNVSIHSTSNVSHMKHELPNLPYYNTGYMPYMHEIKGESQHHEIRAFEPSILRSLNNSGIGYQVGLNNSVIGLNNKLSNGLRDVQWSNTRGLTDLVSVSV